MKRSETSCHYFKSECSRLSWKPHTIHRKILQLLPIVPIAKIVLISIFTHSAQELNAPRFHFPGKVIITREQMFEVCCLPKDLAMRNKRVTTASATTGQRSHSAETTIQGKNRAKRTSFRLFGTYLNSVCRVQEPFVLSHGVQVYYNPHGALGIRLTCAVIE